MQAPGSWFEIPSYQSGLIRHVVHNLERIRSIERIANNQGSYIWVLSRSGIINTAVRFINDELLWLHKRKIIFPFHHFW